MAEPAQTGAPKFRRHRYLSYQGYAFPWYVGLMWLVFLVSAVAYLVRNVLR